MVRQVKIVEMLQAARIEMDRSLSDEVDAAAPLPARIDLAPSVAFPAAWGFHALEWTSDGVPFRWSGPGERCVLPLYVDRAVPVRLELVALGFAPGFDLEELSVDVDGEPCALVWSDVPTGQRAGAAILPPRPHRRATVLGLSAPRLFSLAGEDRRVGFALTGLSIASAD